MPSVWQLLPSTLTTATPVLNKFLRHTETHTLSCKIELRFYFVTLLSATTCAPRTTGYHNLAPVQGLADPGQ